MGPSPWLEKTVGRTAVAMDLKGDATKSEGAARQKIAPTWIYFSGRLTAWALQMTVWERSALESPLESVVMEPVEEQPDEAVTHAEEAVKKLDAAVKKAEDAENRLNPRRPAPWSRCGRATTSSRTPAGRAPRRVVRAEWAARPYAFDRPLNATGNASRPRSTRPLRQRSA